MNASRHRERVLGSLLGLAAGDGLGAQLAGVNPSLLRVRHGVVSDYLYAHPVWTDDTQQALTLVEATVRRGSPDPSWIGQRWVAMADALPERSFGLHRGTTPGFRESVAAFRAHGDWRTSGRTHGAGSGSAMRIAPLATALADLPEDALAATVVDVSLLTHGELRGIAAALAVAWLATRLRSEPGYPLPASRGRALLEELAVWLRDREQRLAAEKDLVTLESARHVHDLSNVLAGVARRFEDGWPAWRVWIERYASARLGRVAHATDGFALCSPATAIALVLGSSRRFEETLVAAVNLGQDTDTIGAMVGGLAGAAAGVKAIPSRWHRLEGWEALVAWGQALARRTSPEAPEPGPGVAMSDEDLPDVFALERRLAALVDPERGA